VVQQQDAVAVAPTLTVEVTEIAQGDRFTSVVVGQWLYSGEKRKPLRIESPLIVILVLNSSICSYLVGNSESGIGNSFY